MKFVLLFLALFISGCSDNFDSGYVKGYQTGYEHGYEHGYESAANKYYFYACYLQKNGYNIKDSHQESRYNEVIFQKMLDINCMVYKK